MNHKPSERNGRHEARKPRGGVTASPGAGLPEPLTGGCVGCEGFSPPKPRKKKNSLAPPHAGPPNGSPAAIDFPGTDLTDGGGGEPPDPPLGRNPSGGGHTQTAVAEPDHPPAQAAREQEHFVWDEEKSPIDNFVSLGSLLSRSGSIYRDAGAGKGLVVVSSDPSVRPRHVTEGKELTALLIDRVRVQVKKKGKNKGGLIGTRHLALMLETEAFLGEFRSLDDVCRTPRYGTNFELTRPGYNDGGPGQRLLYTGPPAAVEYSLDTIKRFLGVMEFDSNADRTNALGAALTIMLRSCWPGGKPVIIVTSTKSHGGKDTILEFACGSTPSTSISYQHANWALENCLVMALKGNPEIGVIKVDNARPEGGEELASAFLERLVMDKDPWFCSPGTGKGFRITNSLVIGLSTNHGSVSQDLMNRSLPIHLSPVGNVGDRNSPIGNPKDHYLPANRDRIDAELRGMIEKWKREGKPLDDSVKHPFTEWSRTVGGILLVNGYSDFLGNYGLRRTADDPIRHALGLLGVVSPNKWKRPRDWARIAVEQSLVKILINWAERDTETGRERRMGVVLSAHMDETFTVETDDGPVTLRLKKHRGRFNNDAEPSTRYCFEEIAGALPPGSGETRSQRSSNAQKDSKAELKARLEEKKRLLEE